MQYNEVLFQLPVIIILIVPATICRTSVAIILSDVQQNTICGSEGGPKPKYVGTSSDRTVFKNFAFHRSLKLNKYNDTLVNYQ